MTIAYARKAIAAGAALAALFFGGTSLAQHLHRHELKAGDRLASFGVRSLDGAGVTLRPSGGAQLINIFATWCPPCRAEAPAFAALAAELKTKGIAVVGIDQQEGAAQVERFLQDFHVTYPVYIDSGTVTHDLLGARVIPMTIYVDASGIIRWEHSGPLTAEDLTQLAQTLKGDG
jgi:thiol-disulfide isomerase/thioredoxin